MSASATTAQVATSASVRARGMEKSVELINLLVAFFVGLVWALIPPFSWHNGNLCARRHARRVVWGEETAVAGPRQDAGTENKTRRLTRRARCEQVRSPYAAASSAAAPTLPQPYADKQAPTESRCTEKKGGHGRTTHSEKMRFWVERRFRASFFFRRLHPPKFFHVSVSLSCSQKEVLTRASTLCVAFFSPHEQRSSQVEKRKTRRSDAQCEKNDPPSCVCGEWCMPKKRGERS